MPIFSNPQNKIAQSFVNTESFAGYETGFMENLSAEYDAFKYVNTHRSRQDALRNVYEKSVAELGDSNIYNPGDFYDKLNGRSTARATGRLPKFYRDQIDEAESGEELAPYFEFRRRHDILMAERERRGLPTFSVEEAQERAKEVATGAQKKALEIQGRSSTLGDIGMFVGSAGAGMRSFLRSPFAPTLIMGAPMKAHLVWGAVIDGLIVGGVEAIAQADVAKWRKSIGLGYDANQFYFNVGAAFVGGAVFSGAIRGAVKGTPLVRDRLDPLGAVGREYSKNVDEMGILELNQKLMDLSERELRAGIEALKKAGIDTPPEVNIALRADDIEEPSPLAPDNLDAHTENLDRQLKAELALLRDEPLNMPHEPTAQKHVPDDIHHYDNLDDFIFRLDLDKVEVDAKVFQFKSGGDKEGVVETLRSVKEWDPYKAGHVIVYEYLDGRQVIADGHQRYGLAKRLLAENPDADIRLYGVKYREADGITPEQAKVHAALTNISQVASFRGAQSTIDAAKVLRIDPSRLGELPAMSQMVRQAKDLVKLSDESFGLVINEIVPTNYAAVVGRLIDDPAKQMAVMRLLAKAEPANSTQAEAIVRQARDMEFRAETQDGLFGVEEMTQSLMLERAKVLDQTLKILKNDKRVFRTLVDNQQRIEAEGNKLSADSNVQRSTTDAQALEIVQAQANRKGAISDALNLAAREYADGKSLAEASRNVAEAVRHSIDRGDLHGAGILSEGRRADIAPEGDRLAASAERESLEQFDEPNGKGSQDQADAAETTLREETTPVQTQQTQSQQALQRLFDDGVEAQEKQLVLAEDLAPADLRRLNQELRGGQNYQNIDDIIDRNNVFNSELNDAVRAAAGKHKIVYVAGKAKERARIVEKIEGKYNGQLNYITDVSRATVTITKPGEADNFIRSLSGSFHVVDEGYAGPRRGSDGYSGYYDKKLMVINSEGLIGEVIIIERNLFEAKRGIGHQLYKIQRGSDIDIAVNKIPDGPIKKRLQALLGDDEAVRAAAQLEGRNLYEAAHAKMDPEFVQLTGNLLNDPPQLSSVSANSAPVSSTVRVSARSSDDLISPQSPSESRQINALPSSERTAGIEPSSAKNLTGTSDLNIGDSARVRNVEPTAQGEQTLIEGVAPITSATRAQAAVDAPLTGGVRPMDEGLFDTGARAQMDLLDMAIPVGQRIDDAGETVAETQTIKSMFDEFEQDKSMIDRLKDCI